MAQKKDKEFILYMFYYGAELVYIGRTSQLLQDRIRNHLFKTPMVRTLDVNKISKIEYTVLNSEADMFLYEIYLINKYKPKFNKDDKAKDNLTIELPELNWTKFSTHLWEKWKFEINKRDLEEKLFKEEILAETNLKRNKKKELHNKLKNGEISNEEYLKSLDEIFF